MYVCVWCVCVCEVCVCVCMCTCWNGAALGHVHTLVSHGYCPLNWRFVRTTGCGE